MSFLRAAVLSRALQITFPNFSCWLVLPGPKCSLQYSSQGAGPALQFPPACSASCRICTWHSHQNLGSSYMAGNCPSCQGSSQSQTLFLTFSSQIFPPQVSFLVYWKGEELTHLIADLDALLILICHFIYQEKICGPLEKAKSSFCNKYFKWFETKVIGNQWFQGP